MCDVCRLVQLETRCQTSLLRHLKNRKEQQNRVCRPEMQAMPSSVLNSVTDEYAKGNHNNQGGADPWQCVINSCSVCLSVCRSGYYL